MENVVIVFPPFHFVVNQKFYVPLPEKRIGSMLDYAYENYLNEEKYKMRFLKTSTILEMLNLPDGKYGICDNSEARKKLEEERAIRREQKSKRDVIICSKFNHLKLEPPHDFVANSKIKGID